MTMIRLGAEFPPVPQPASEEAWAAFKALRPTLAKFRMGASPWRDIHRAVVIMRHYTDNPWVLLRPSGEVPEAADLWSEFASQYWELLNWPGVTVILEPANEPNHPQTRLDLGTTLAEQLANYQRRLKGYLHLRARFSGLWLVSPGMMQSGDLGAWWTPERAPYDYEGFHLYGQGPLGLMLPPHFNKPAIATEVGYDDTVSPPPDRTQRIIDMMEVARGYGAVGFAIFLLRYGPSPWEHQYLTIEAAQAYAAWRDKVNEEEEPMLWRERYPEVFAFVTTKRMTEAQFEAAGDAWQAAGGKPGLEFLNHLVGTRKIPVDQALYTELTERLKSSAEEIKQAALPYLPLATGPV